MAAELRKSLGFPSLAFYGIGAIIGAGIYSVIGAAAGKAGPALWISSLLGAFVAALTALSYAELAAMFPRAGAEYVYVRKAMPTLRLAAFLVGALVALTAATTAATVALAFGGYVRVFLEIPAWISAACLLLVCTLLNIAGLKLSSGVNILFTLVEITGLCLVIWAGWQRPEFGEALTQIPGASGSAEWTGVLVGAGLIFFVYTGFEGLANLAEEAKKPERDLPLALMTSVGVTTVLYVLVALAVVALADPAELAESDSPLAMAAGKASPRLATALAAIALFATANTALICFVVGSRVLFGMARGSAGGNESSSTERESHMPRALGKTLPGRKSPWVATLVLLAVAAILLPLGRVEVVASLSSLISLFVFLVVNAALIVLRRRQPDLARSFRVPLSVAGIPIPPVLAMVAALALMVRFEGRVYAAAAVAVAVCLTVYAVGRKRE